MLFLTALWKDSMYWVDLKLTLSCMDTSTDNTCFIISPYRRSSCAALKVLPSDIK